MHTTVFMQALADDTRLRTFRILAQSKYELCVAELADILQKPQYATSRALGELRKAGLLSENRHGKLVFYRLTNTKNIESLGAWVLENCECDPAKTNTDGSHQPGSTPCAYDSERLGWRLELRDKDQKVAVTYPENANDQRPSILYVCVHNSARSQFAEAYTKQLAPGKFRVASAGLQPGVLNPYVVAVLAQEGLDISQKTTQAVNDVFRTANRFDYVITVCDPEVEKACPRFPGPLVRQNWPFPDPAAFRGSPESIFEQTRELGIHIQNRIKVFLQNLEAHRSLE